MAIESVTGRPAFFSEFERVEVHPEEILRGEENSAASAYRHYWHSLLRDRFQRRADPCRHGAQTGSLDDSNYSTLNQILEALKDRARQEKDKFRGYARVNHMAMRIAQILFVNNAVKEGLDSRIHGYDQLVTRLEASLPGTGPLASERRFQAVLFVLQRAFDRLFVPEQSLGSYELRTGEYVLSPRYRQCTRYLDLSAIRVMEASQTERSLCMNITTGWSEGIDAATWDQLNSCYYGARSPLTGEPNYFASHYDDLLERMLPQFAYSKVRLARSIVRRMQAGKDYRVLEIGAGSGAFAIDLLMACRRFGRAGPQVEYLGLEPSAFMIENFQANLLRKTGEVSPNPRFRIQQGSLEQAHANLPNLIASEAGRETICVFCFSPHHIYGPSLRAFLEDPRVKGCLSEIYVLEGTERHGWTKAYYMWVDCESPENFDNVTAHGIWQVEELWEEPDEPLEVYSGRITNAWCRARRLG